MLEINVAAALNKRMMTVYCKSSFDILKLLKVERAKNEKKKNKNFNIVSLGHQFMLEIKLDLIKQKLKHSCPFFVFLTTVFHFVLPVKLKSNYNFNSHWNSKSFSLFCSFSIHVRDHFSIQGYLFLLIYETF